MPNVPYPIPYYCANLYDVFVPGSVELSALGFLLLVFTASIDPYIQSNVILACLEGDKVDDDYQLWWWVLVIAFSLFAAFVSLFIRSWSSSQIKRRRRTKKEFWLSKFWFDTTHAHTCQKLIYDSDRMKLIPVWVMLVCTPSVVTRIFNAFWGAKIIVVVVRNLLQQHAPAYWTTT